MEELKPWYMSRTVWAGIVILVSAVISATTGIALTSAEQVLLVDFIFEIIAALGGMAAIWGRVIAQKKIA